MTDGEDLSLRATDVQDILDGLTILHDNYRRGGMPRQAERTQVLKLRFERAYTAMTEVPYDFDRKESDS